LAAGYLSDLYTILGNEAFADAANPTISLDDQDTITEVNTSRFSFEGQVSSSLEEELGLLRGRDDFLSPQVTQAPFYNRLFWNYTRGIDSGEVLYAVNYNIKEKVGSSTEDGIINAADAQRMFPQGHGDAYGHYLSALKGYYKLLTNPSFTWKPRIESLNVLGNTISVDYQDERKFAEAAANVATVAEQVVKLTHRQQYHDDPAAGWEHFSDGKENTQTGKTRRWGLDEWVSRSTQGAFFHWMVGNAMVQEEDFENSGIQKIDRTTVVELQRLPILAESFQTTYDNASAHLNPLGLSPGAIAFDISPAEMQSGNSHYKQVYDRALSAVLNAKGSFDQAGRMTRLLRNQENQIDDFNTAINDQETAYTYNLIDIYGTPFPGDIGPGKTYAQGYAGPDLTNWFVVDRKTSVLIDTSKVKNVVARVPVKIRDFKGLDTMDIEGAGDEKEYETVTLGIAPNSFVQFSDLWRPGVDLGQRAVTGRLQQALQDAQLASIDLLEAEARAEAVFVNFQRRTELILELVKNHKAAAETRSKAGDEAERLDRIRNSLEAAVTLAEFAVEESIFTGDAVAEALPVAAGTSVDATSTARSKIKVVAGIAAKLAGASLAVADKQIYIIEQLLKKGNVDLEEYLSEQSAAFEEKQMLYEYSVQYREMVNGYYETSRRVLALQRAAEAVRNVLAEGDRIQLDREGFRKRAAAIVQGYRTKDLTFRVFRNEALEQYRTLFDLASRYTYLAAKSYDYETGLLGTPQGLTVFNNIVASRSLGDLTNDVPQSTVSTLGDSGLAGTMARMNADFSVAEGRLGINNPDQYGTVFSLRSELFRLLDDPTVTNDDEAWQQTLEQHITANLMNDPDVVAYCRNIRKPDGTPVPGLIIPFSSTIQHTKNFFGLNIAAGDHGFTPGNYATKIFSVGIAFPGYVGMDAYAAGNMNSGTPARNAPNALSATPYVYLIPCGSDSMLAPPLGDTNTVRTWKVQDQALPLPYNLGANDFNSTQFFNANGTLSERPWIIRKHQPFRPVSDPSFFYSSVPQEFTNTRLIGRSVWNSQWKIVIPAYPMLNDENEALNRFAASVKDIQLFLRTYSHSGN
jgi:hypothetical protein